MQWIQKTPKLAHLVGQALFSFGGLLIVGGLLGRVAMSALNQARAIAKIPPYAGLSEAYPMYPLWWVPEHFKGYALAAVIAGFGIYIALSAKAILKDRRKRR